MIDYDKWKLANPYDDELPEPDVVYKCAECNEYYTENFEKIYDIIDDAFYMDIESCCECELNKEI